LGRDCRQRTSILFTDDIPISIWILFWYVIIIICMNKRIEELALQCGAWHQVYDQKRFMVDRKFDVEQFAELIVKECADVATMNQFQYDAVGNYVLKHFGVE
jgi:hypothetical protein